MQSRDVDFLRRLIADRPSKRAAVAAKTLAEQEGVGTVKGSSVVYGDQDYVKAQHLLTSRGFSASAPSQPFTRSTAPAGGSEKKGALRVSEDMVAVVPIGIAGIATPNGSLLGLPSDRAIDLDYEVLLVCENLESLLQVHTYSWLPRFIQNRPTLALFRGAPGYFRTDTAALFIRDDSRPTLAFFDFDPKGLSMAAGVPRREALCLPDWEPLRSAVLKNRRTHLFTNSAHECRSQLDGFQSGEIADAWARMKVLAMGLDQEHFPR